jgi:hypothetical protein
MEQDIAEIVEEIEKEKALGKISAVQVFRGMLNQPELLSVSSANADQNGSSYAYSQFTVNMPRPILEAETLQLLAANIPLCTQNFPDTACGFWYYRLDEYAGQVPNTENLFFVRLLPSYYKPELIQSGIYGFNETFNTYTDVASQLSFSCANDLAYDSWRSLGSSAYYQVQYIPNDISITYNSAQNKFQMTGLNTPAPLVPFSPADTYNAGMTYAAGVYITYADKLYRSLQAGNLNHTPGITDSRTWWAFVTDRLVRDWVQGTSYRKGSYIYAPSYSPPSIRQTTTDYYASTPSFTGGGNWVVPTAQFNYRYLATGYADPNVVLNQGNGRRQWNQYALYETDTIVQYQGQPYQATKQNRGWMPFPYPTSFYTFATTGSYAVGDYVVYLGYNYVCIKATAYSSNPVSYAVIPGASGTDNAYWQCLQYNTAKTTYKIGDIVSYIGTLYIAYWKCVYNNPPANSINVNPFVCEKYWLPSYWIPLSDSSNIPIIGLNSISAKFDMTDAVAGVPQVPFPTGIPGQPFNPNPRRLLNSLLGFCWNGIFDASIIAQSLPFSADYISVNNGVALFLNRIRPIPPYLPGVGIDYGGGIPTSAITFTADGYANLVYTSVVSIYSTIVYGSTLDSQRNTNLIGLSSMNAGNLGVSFFDNKINGPLRVKGADIYSISIELRDEMNEPYPLWNSAVATFTLKLTYKENLAEK